ncbi:MAG TPA: hypothetical protein VJ565_02195 [Dehalococcoidia bacterium]|nr:hypothetical protein [Dehalococcoidia bacterium]
MFSFGHDLDRKQLYQLLKDMIELGFWPDALYFIISLQDPKAPQVRAFFIRGGRVTEEQLTIR